MSIDMKHVCLLLPSFFLPCGLYIFCIHGLNRVDRYIRDSSIFKDIYPKDSDAAERPLQKKLVCVTRKKYMFNSLFLSQQVKVQLDHKER